MSGTDGVTSPLPSAILFDLDGTLIATRRLYVQAFADALEPVVGNRLTEPEIMERVPRAERRFLAELAGREHASATLERFYESYARRHDQDFQGVYTGIPEALSDLRMRSVAMGIVTGKSRRSWEITAPRIGLGPFHPTVFDDDVPAQKPHPAGLELALQHLGLTPEEAIYVGDSLTDLEAAAAAGVRAAAVLWSKKAEEVEGFRRESLDRGARLVASPAELLDLVDGRLPGSR
jgi:pyrophosphatase PpaX